MPKYVAFLRGVNVGGKRKVPMAQLRDLLESLGHRDVRTFIASGNVLFASARSVTPSRLEAAIEEEFGLDVDVVLRTPAQLKSAVRGNPFKQADPAKIHIGFMAKKPAVAVVAKLDKERFLPEEFAVRGTDIYYHLPNGLGRTKLLPYVERQLKVPTTVRNWNTLTKLVELSAT